jgi:uncharacterized protein (TIGR02996 family)
VPRVRNPELEAALAADPDDAAAYATYARWLTDHGSPHGELIYVQIQLEADPRSVALRWQEAELLHAHGSWLVGEALAPQVDLLGWYRGFVAAAEVERDHLIELIAHPAGRLLRDAAIHGERTLQPAIDALIAAAPPLVALSMAIISYDPEPAHDIGDLGALWPALPRLERLVLSNGAMALGEPVLPRLRELVLRPAVMSAGNLRSLAGAAWPALERMELWFEHVEDHHADDDDDDDDDREDRGGDAAAGRWAGDHAPPRSAIAIDDVHALLASAGLSSLRDLTISNTALGDDLCRALAASPLASQLHRLALTRGTISDAGAAVLMASLAGSRSLRQLDLDENRIASPGLLSGFPRDGKRLYE